MAAIIGSGFIKTVKDDGKQFGMLTFSNHSQSVINYHDYSLPADFSKYKREKLIAKVNGNWL